MKWVCVVCLFLCLGCDDSHERAKYRYFRELSRDALRTFVMPVVLADMKVDMAAIKDGRVYRIVWPTWSELGKEHRECSALLVQRVGETCDLCHFLRYEDEQEAHVKPGELLFVFVNACHKEDEYAYYKTPSMTSAEEIGKFPVDLNGWSWEDAIDRALLPPCKEPLDLSAWFQHKVCYVSLRSGVASSLTHLIFQSEESDCSVARCSSKMYTWRIECSRH